MSMSAFPHGVVPAAAAAGGTLTLNSLSSSRTLFGPGSITSGVRVLTNEDVEEITFNGLWLSQNPGVEWIDDLGGASASDYEVQLTGTQSGVGTFSGPALSQFHAISTTRQWTLTRSTQGSATFSGTMTIREIANTSNSVSAVVLLSSTIDQF